MPYIEGIVLGGSRARGTHTEDSDIDIGIYYNQESFDLTAINQIATELDDENRNNLVVPPGAWGDWINGGGWLVMNGYHVDLILRDIKRVEQIIKDTEQGIVTANYQTGHPHGYISAMYRGELAISKIQYAKNGKKYYGCLYFGNAIKKYGWENFVGEILLDGLTYEEACQKEKDYIKLYKTNLSEYGYNLHTGGEGPSKESVEKMRESHKNKKLSEEHRKHISRFYHHHSHQRPFLAHPFQDWGAWQ